MSDWHDILAFVMGGMAIAMLYKIANEATRIHSILARRLLERHEIENRLDRIEEALNDVDRNTRHLIP